MSVRHTPPANRRYRDRGVLLRLSVSLPVMALAIVSSAAPAHAQLTARRGATGPATAPVAGRLPGQVRTPGASDALGRQVATRSRADQIRSYVTQAKVAIARSVPDGSAGLVVARGVTAEALASGALRAARDSTGRATWQGANLPVETSASGSSLVSITQTEARAILSWDRFDVGANTTVQFIQKVGGVAQKDWVAVNRVVDPAAAPSQILGQIKADGTVVVINRNGMIFGNGARVSVNSLLASSLDIGNFLKPVVSFRDASTGLIDNGLLATTVQERNIAFLQDGLLQKGASQGSLSLGGMLTSALASGFYSSRNGRLDPQFGAVAEGGISVERGASITAGTGGFVILTAPTIGNDGALSADEGQVSLQSGRAVTANASTGASGKVGEDPFVRGLILRTPFASPADSVVNTGLIETKRGYASLGASLGGSVINGGLIAATTSVSRNGMISLTGGRVTLSGADAQAQSGGLVILPDSNGETIPQGISGLPDNFKASQIRLGAVYIDPLDAAANPLGDFGPASISLGGNSLILAPGANARIGGAAGEAFAVNRYEGTNVIGARTVLEASRIDMGSGALIDVSGVKDVTLEASRNSLLINPLKRNELRDTPNYRDTNTNGDFTLNGATVYVDPRVSGVRADGVAYVGSPLIEAGSAASQIGVKADELMTRGGTVSLGVALPEGPTSADIAPRITIAGDAGIDFSGGWVRYLDGVVRTSRLLTADGRVIDIGTADPDDNYVAVGDGFEEVQAKFGISRVFANSILQGATFEPGYDEGRDAGALSISTALLTLDGSLWGNAFAGVRQTFDGKRSSRSSTLSGDMRQLQARTSELPSGGLLRIGTYAPASTDVLAADMIVGRPGALLPSGAIVLDDAKLSAAGLSGLSLATSGSVNLLAGSDLKLANGGGLNIFAGRSIAFAGSVTASGGTISARTLTTVDVATGRALGTAGSPFRTNDDIASLFSAVPDVNPFDITVSGKLSTAGLWANDFTAASFAGPAWSDGGSISLEVAPSAFFGVGGTFSRPLAAADLSGSIRIASSALLDVSSGGYVGIAGAIDFSGKGGNVSLINRTHYASYNLTENRTDSNARAGFPLGGINQSVQFTPYDIGQTSVVPALVPDNPNSVVSFGTASLRGFGFAGGGTFRLVAPDIAMGSQPGAKGPRIGLDFLSKTGFGTLDLSAFKSRLVANLFDNGRTGLSAFIETERFVVGAGETLDLTQTVLPSIIDIATLDRLTGLATGSDVYSVLAPVIPADAWDRKAANLTLGGFSELEVAQGGTLTGAAGAAIVAPRLYNAGTIRIAGGSIRQVDPFSGVISLRRMIGVRDAVLGGGGLSDVLGGGIAGQASGFDEDAPLNAAVFADRAQTQRLTNGQLFSFLDGNASANFDALLVFTGRTGLQEGMHLAASSITDLSGTVIYDPRSGFFANGSRQQTGRMVAGGSISTSAFGAQQSASGFTSAINPGNQLVAEAAAQIKLDGGAGAFDIRSGQNSFTRAQQWSDAGSLVIGGGAQLAGALISARGGDDGDADPLQTRANGGLLDWVAPRLVQSYTAADSAGTTIAVDQIAAAGFDAMVARNDLTAAGQVSLSLGRSFIATTTTAAGQLTADNLVVAAAPGAAASISAPYVRLESSSRRLTRSSSVTGAGSILLNAGAIDVVGAVEFIVGDRGAGSALGSATLSATGDIRFIGAAGLPDSTTGLFQPGITGVLASSGDLTLRAAQAYATTGTGNLQQLLEDRRTDITPKPTPFVVASESANGTVAFERSGTTLPDTPLSAGSYLAVRGANVRQDGILRAPLGYLDIGDNVATDLGSALSAPATKTLVIGNDSLTSTSARTSPTGDGALNVPYGTTTDLIEYFFTPGTSQVLSAVPVGELRLAGGEVTITSAASGDVRVDTRGGGDIFAYEFIPGTGGSRDVLDRFNADSFSGNAGLQFPDGRQVYAILPKTSGNIALFDPIYSADYAGGAGGDLYGADAGKSVFLDAAPGIAAGEYLLLPAHYALLPGGMRLVENVGADVPYSGGAATLLDGSIVVGGTYGTAGTGLVQSSRHSFTVQNKSVFEKYSNIQTTSGTSTVVKLAERDALSVPKLPRDAARVTLAPLTTLRVSGAFATDAATNGLGSQFDIGGTKIRIAAPGAIANPATSDFVLLTTDTIANFKAESLSIGAFRTDNVDGTTMLDVATNQLLVDNNVTLTAPELLLSVGGPGALLTIADAPRGATGALLQATGTLSQTRTGDYIVNATVPRNAASGPVDLTGVGAVVRLSTGAERLVTRQGDFALRNTLAPARLDIGAGAALRAASITLDSSRTFAIDRTAAIGAAVAGTPFDLAVSGDSLRLGSLTFAPGIEAQFGQARNLTYRTPDILNFTPGAYRYNNLRIDAGGIALAQPIAAAAQTSDVSIVADRLVLGNSSKDVGACKDLGSRVCAAGSNLNITANDITFRSGQLRTWGFDSGLTGKGVTLTATQGMYVAGSGGFSMVNFDENIEAPLNFITPFIVDRTDQDVRLGNYVRPEYTFAAIGAINVLGSGLSAVPAAGLLAPGAHLTFQTGDSLRNSVSDITVDNALIRAAAGRIELLSTGSILLQGATSLQAPGFTKSFDDGLRTTTVSAGAGSIRLISSGAGSIIDTSADSSLVIDSGVGDAGSLVMAASTGEINLRSRINPGVAAGTARNSSFTFDSGQSAFDFSGFVDTNGAKFGGNLSIRSGIGDLALRLGQAIRADSVSLVADGGQVSIAGQIDTSGDNVQGLAATDPRYKAARIDGGAISLYGREGVTLAGTAALLATTSGYGAQDSRQAKGGAITIGVGIQDDSTRTAALTIASGARLDVSALRPGDRPIAEIAIDPQTRLESTFFRLASGDLGGTVSFRAPLLAGNRVAFDNAGTVTGASSLSLEAFRRFDLDSIAAQDRFSGVSVRVAFPADFIVLDPGASMAGKANFLTDMAAGTLPDFIRNFSITAASGTSLAGYRLRPGVELTSTGDIRLASIWNLGAGEIVNNDRSAGYADALAAGLLVASPLGQFSSGALAGQTAYEVVAGKEAELFSNFINMTYRVGGSVRGEAPVLTLRSARSLDIGNSISDGFFTFHDLTNPDFIDYQLGGGNRTYNPALRLSCGAGDAATCEDSVTFAASTKGPVAGPPSTRVTILVGAALQGAESSQFFINSPYNPLANAAAPSGTGDAIGVGELFPRLTDGSAVHSTSLQLVAGALQGSVNPMQVDVAQTGSVKVSGETSYRIAASRGRAALSGNLQLMFDLPDAVPEFYDIEDLLALIDSGTNAQFNPDFYTLLSWGGGNTAAGNAARTAARAYAPFQTRGHFVGTAANPTGITAGLRDVIAFLRDTEFADTYANGVVNRLPGYSQVANLLAPFARLQNNTVSVGTVVRTGDGSVSVAAADDIDLRRTIAPVLRRDPGGVGSSVEQVGGTAIYTAGVRVSAASLRGAVLPAFNGYSASFIPGPTSGLALAPVFSENGGAVSLVAGRDIVGRRDAWGDVYGDSGSPIVGIGTSAILNARGYGQTTALMASSYAGIGQNSPNQRWRYGAIGFDDVRGAISPGLFTSGVGALAGGDVTIQAGGHATDLTIALNNSMVTSNAGGAKTLVSLGGGNLNLTVGQNLGGGQIDIASGTATIIAGGDVADAGTISGADPQFGDNRNLLRLRVSDATAAIAAAGSVTVGGLGSLGVTIDQNGFGLSNFFSPFAGVDLRGNGDVAIAQNRPELYLLTGNGTPLATYLPPSLAITANFGDIAIGSPDAFLASSIMAASRFGQLSLIAGGDIANLSLAMSDAAPVNYFGRLEPLALAFPRALNATSDADLRALHNRRITHLNNPVPVQILAAGSIEQAVLNLPKQAQIHAGGDIVNMSFQGQNVSPGDVTRISAGGDIVGTVAVSTDAAVLGRSGVQGNTFALGGPGSLFIEAGRNLGPFVTSAAGTERSEAGGIRTIGNEANPWLTAQGANIYALFGVGKGAAYSALQSTYLDPANLGGLDGDLFVQQADELGNKRPDRSRYVYAPVLADWLRSNAPDSFTAVFGAAAPTGDALSSAAYTRYDALYAAFAGLDQLSRNRFLIDKLYFGELAAPSDPAGPSFNQYVRGYRAVQTLFPAQLGYTDNLATYTTDPATVTADNPLGVPVRNLVDGQPAVAATVLTGSVDLRLSTIETTRGGDVTILGPGGNFVGGSVVRTEAQVNRRVTANNVSGGLLDLSTDVGFRDLLDGNYQAPLTSRGLITSIPQGFEGVLTLRGGQIRSFTDGSFILNQSRLFTQRGGDITLWSSNGDLNAGQGPRSSSNFPPISLRFGPNGFSEVDSAGSVSGAGIGAFKASPSDPDASIRLIAPVGTVDAGDAGVRASGSVFVAAARVANADSFSAGGSISGVPSLAVSTPPPAPASAASAVSANAFRAGDALGGAGNRAPRIFVDVLGFFGAPACASGQSPDANGQCAAN